ncbi:conserved hypothetical protein [bacterium A37T11]|nr:conserved hypothetical protein [bacterium A37T11]
MTRKKIADRLLEQLTKGEAIRMEFPGNGLLVMERPVPFLIAYRIPADGKDDFTSTLCRTESSYLMAADGPEMGMAFITGQLAKALSDKFGGFLLLEIWLSNQARNDTFTIHLNQKSALPVAEKLYTELQGISIGQTQITTRLNKGKTLPHPPHFHPLMNDDEARKHEIIFIGLEIAPVYINILTGTPFPIFLRELRDAFSRALRKSFFEFVRMRTSYHVTHFEMLGTTVLENKVYEIDHELAEYSNLFDFLLLVTPINVKDAWQHFAKSGFTKDPVFHYRPLPIDPEIIKRKIYNLPIEDISDPTIASLFRDKRKEIDRMLNMMAERDKPDFMHSSQQIFGGVEENLLETARAILVAIGVPPHVPKKDMLNAVEFAKMAEEELAWLKIQEPEISTVVRVRDDVEGIMVSRGILNISKNYQVPRNRAFSLLQHEIGTHVVTYYNGKAQPLKLFYIGVPGYEQLQEGLAVFAEYMTGGLSNDRLRILAARVLAVHHMVAGNSFANTFFMLTEHYLFKPEVAFHICMRVYRGGGLTKDAVYLKGLLHLIEYLKQGNDLGRLLIGKIRQDYLPIVEELIHRRLLVIAPIQPRYMQEPYLQKIASIRKNGSVFKMIN